MIPRHSDAPRWPTTESRLGAPPMQRFAVPALLVFLAIGIFVMTPWGPPLEPGQSAVIVYVFGGAFIFLSLLGFVGLFVDKRRNRPFRHATEEVLPDVPREPVLPRGEISHSLVTHQLEPTASGIRLIPKVGLFKPRIRFGYLWMTFIGTAVSAGVWLSPNLRDEPVQLKVLLTAASFILGYAVVLLASFFGRRAEQKLRTLEIDLNQRHCRLTCGEETTTVEMDKLVAVQLCAAYRRIGRKYEGFVFPAVELNLVWEAEREPADRADRFERATVMNLGCTFHRLIPIAQELAEVLDVPLLNHVTREHWKIEARRSKDRPYETEGGSM